MSFVTINKYLYGDIAEANVDTAQLPPPSWPAFAAGLMESVKSSVMMGEEAADIRSKLENLQGDVVQAQSDASLSEIAARFSEVTHSFGEESVRRQAQRGQEVLQLFTILNESLLFANSTCERSGDFTATLESSLNAAIRTPNTQTLRRHLSEMLAIVQEEVKHQRKIAGSDLASINRQARQARRAYAGIREELGSRDEAIAAIESGLLNPLASGAWYSGIFVIERLRAIRTRYGTEIVSELVSDLFAKRIQPIAKDAKGFLWTPESILLLFPQKKDRPEIREEVAAKVAGPFEHRAQLGMRSASLSVELRWVIGPIEGTLNDNVWSADRFVEGR